MASRSLRNMVERQQALNGSTPVETRVLSHGGLGAHSAPKRSTFVIEALLLFICLMVVVSVSISVIAFSATKGAEAAHEQKAIVMATNIAEQFSADPTSIEGSYTDGDYTAKCSIALSMDNAGTLYDAHISVDWRGDEVCSINTSRYVSHTDPLAESVDADDGQVL